MLVWLTLPFYDFCGFRSVAVNSVYKLQFYTFITLNNQFYLLTRKPHSKGCSSNNCADGENDLDEIWNSVSQMWRLAAADLGHDPHSSASLRGIVPPPPKKKRKNCSQNFQVLRLQTIIIPQW